MSFELCETSSGRLVGSFETEDAALNGAYLALGAGGRAASAGGGRQDVCVFAIREASSATAGRVPTPALGRDLARPDWMRRALGPISGWARAASLPRARQGLSFLLVGRSTTTTG
jgi:hypothetical protein